MIKLAIPAFNRNIHLFNLLITFLIISDNTIGQGDYHNLFIKGKYSKAAEKLKVDYQKNPGSVSTNYSLAKLYNSSDFQNYCTDSAYYFAKRAEAFYRISDAKELKKIARDDINSDTLVWLKKKIILNALQDAENKNTIPGYNHFIDNFGDAEASLKNHCSLNIHLLAFELANKQNSISGFNEFIKTYPYATQVPLAIVQRNQLAYTDATKSDAPEDYRKFINTYPDATEVPHAWDRIYILEYKAIEQCNNPQKFKEYSERYPGSSFAKTAKAKYERLIFLENTIPGDAISYEMFIERFPQGEYVASAIDSLISISEAQKDCLPVRYLLENHREKTNAQQLMHMLYRQVASDGELLGFNWFAERYPDYEDYDSLEKDRALALSIDTLNLNKLSKKSIPLLEKYIVQAAPCRQAYKALIALIQPRIDAREWSTCLIQLKKYEPYFKDDSRFVALVGMLSEKSSGDITRNSFGKLVNSTEGDEYSPTISGDFKQLYFCGKERKDNLGGEDIFESTNINGVWQKPRLVGELCTPTSNDAPLDISTDGTQMLIFKSGVIHATHKQVEGWSEPEILPEPINKGSWNADAMFTSDGMALLFSSQREGGYNFESDASKCKQFPTDIYICLKMGDGWSEPINLGPVINTSGCERTPFLHPDMKTLYFSSDGHGGLGNLDVYKSTRLSDTSWTQWSKPENLGKDVNGTGNDWGYKISTDGTKAYFSESKILGVSANQHLCWINLPPRMRPDYVATIKGHLKTHDNKPIQAKLIYEDLATGKVIGEAQSDPITGNFFIVLPLGRMYGYHVDKIDYFPISGNIDLRASNTAVEKIDTIKMVTFRQMADNGIALPINNLFFNFAEKTLLPYSIPELKRVGEIIKKNNLVVEIAGHTDNIGDSSFNMQLSIGRANSVKTFLIEQGTHEEDLKIIGYGQEKPVTENSTEQGRAMNRRVEIKILKR